MASAACRSRRKQAMRGRRDDESWQLAAVSWQLLQTAHCKLQTYRHSFIAAVVDAAIRQGHHAARDPGVDHHRAGLRNPLRSRGAELLATLRHPPPHDKS